MRSVPPCLSTTCFTIARPRPEPGIARAVGSNNRMLLYYFGSKERLLEAASEIAIERFPHLAAVFERLATSEMSVSELRSA